MGKRDNYTINSRIEYLRNRNQEVSRLRKSGLELPGNRTQEYIDTILKSYDQSTDVDKICRVINEKGIELRGYRSIGIYQAIAIAKYFAKDYYWIPFFSDVGRAISRGERKYINNRIGKYIRGVDESISYTKPDFNILGKYVTKLLEKDLHPNMLLAPIQLYAKFLKYYESEIAESNWRTDHITIEGCKLQLVWSHRYAPLRSFIVFDSSAGIWHVLKDIDTEKRLTVAIGESKEKDNKIVFLVETMAYYQILNQDAFVRINLSY
jgi:hypothetical protein